MPRTSRRHARRNHARALQAARQIVPQLEADLARVFIGWAKPILERHGILGAGAPPEKIYPTARRIWNRPVVQQRTEDALAPMQMSENPAVKKAIEELLAARVYLLDDHPWIIKEVHVRRTEDGRHQLFVVSELQMIAPNLLVQYAKQGDPPLPPPEKLDKDWVLEACRRTVGALPKIDIPTQEA